MFGASLWGREAGLVAAALYATIPMNNTLLGWHGLGNLYGICLLPLALLAAGWALPWLRRESVVAAQREESRVQA